MHNPSFEELLNNLNKMEELSKQFCENIDPAKLTRGQALRLLGRLSDLMEKIQICLNKLPDIKQVARPGPSLKEEIHVREVKIREKARDLESLRQEVEKLAEIEEQLHQQERELKRLQKRKEHLERLKALVESGALEEMRKQVAYLERQQELLEAEELEQALAKGARKVAQLSEAHIQLLNSEAQKLLQIAIDKEKELVEAQERLQEARERYRCIEEALQQCRDELKPYEEADRRIAEVILQGERKLEIREALDKVKAALEAIDEALRRAIDENEKQQQRQPIYLGGPS